jgi:hypothetical protein
VQPLPRDLQIPTRRGDVRVIEELLHLVRRHSVFEQPRSGLAPQIMKR